jgi:transposase
MKRNQDYTSEFRAEAVKVVLTQGLSIAEGAMRLSVPKGTLGHWVAKAKTSTGTVAELEAQVSQLPLFKFLTPWDGYLPGHLRL